MKILVVDREPVTFELIKAKLEPLGHKVLHEAVRNNTVERLKKDQCDAIFIDPTPLTTPRSFILGVRREVPKYPYMFLVSESASREEAIKSGANDIMNKPLDPTVLNEKIGNAERLLKLVNHIGDDGEDFPSAGGVIAKSAFNQLFLSSMDRADRYGERTYILFISLSNYQDIRNLDGQYSADYSAAKLSQYLVLLRRQSDIIGQTAKHEFALLLQRPVYETEPVEAANRFAESLAGFKDIAPTSGAAAEITVSLVNVPVGANPIEHKIKIAGK